MKFSRISVVFLLLAFFFILLFVTQGYEEESNEMVVGSANLTQAGKGDDHDCKKCSKEGEKSGSGSGSDSEESVFENEDYIYTQSFNP